MLFRISTVSSIALLAFSSFAWAEEKVSVNSLAWMTGNWVGEGPQVLEENWITPSNGSIGSLVRSTSNGETRMIEMIVIEEEEGSLVLRVQQWNPGFAPRTPGPQTMKLVALEESRVSFKSIAEGGMAGLTYSRPTPDTFNIDVDLGQRTITIPLKKRQ
jgi:hypothetical protein